MDGTSFLCLYFHAYRVTRREHFTNPLPNVVGAISNALSESFLGLGSAVVCNMPTACQLTASPDAYWHIARQVSVDKDQIKEGGETLSCNDLEAIIMSGAHVWSMLDNRLKVYHWGNKQLSTEQTLMVVEQRTGAPCIIDGEMID
jgi:hypothetical protein